MPYTISAERRMQYREVSIRSKERKASLLANASGRSAASRSPRLDPDALMPQQASSGLTGLSIFSGGGGLDLGFELAGVEHAASFEILEICGRTLCANRPGWKVFPGTAGDVTQVDWKPYRGIDIVHGGPPCQPFSIAGAQGGVDDPRNLWSEFVRCVLSAKPLAFVAENVPGLLDPKFASFVEKHITGPLSGSYEISQFLLLASDFGVPQTRKRVIFVGFRRSRDAKRFCEPMRTHSAPGETAKGLQPASLARWSLGLSDIGFDALAPTLRSGFTGPRNTTGVVNSRASLAAWHKLGIWPNGVQRSRALAAAYPPENGHVRLAVEDCALLQGFPESWRFEGAVYQVIGQIGNSVAPPAAYHVARSVLAALGA
jgi:DNA (cytosine-5)-methyltransferase 1